ncbi:MAG: cardiolipin synthase ClsB [Methylophilaceae bacterium]
MAHFVAGNQIKLLRNGAEYFPALETAIAHAKHDVYLQTYIYQVDKAGTRIGHALTNAAKRGVAVHLMLDGFGCKDLPEYFVSSLEQAGVQVLIYRPKISPWTLKKSRLRRLHQKVAVIDGKIGFVGGINIIDDYNIPEHAHQNAPPRIDYAVRIEGKLLTAITANVSKLWRRMAWIRLLPVQPFQYSTKRQSSKAMQLAQRKNARYNTTAAFVIRDNVLHRHDIEEAYLNAIQHAKHEIIIANAYFVPGIKFRHALIEAAKRGVNIKLVLQGRMEYYIMFATHAFYSEFLKNGIEIYEYRKSFMHSKVAVIDQNWVTVGSSNIDPFSLLLAREANIVLRDAAFAGELRADILNDIQSGAEQVLPQQWARGNMLKRLASWVAYGFVRLLLSVIGRSNEH